MCGPTDKHGVIAEKIQNISHGIANRVGVRSRIQQSYRTSCVLRDDQGTGVALPAEIAAYNADLIRVVHGELGSGAVAIDGVIDTGADVRGFNRGACQSGGAPRFCDRPADGHAAFGNSCAPLRSARHGNAISVRRRAEINDVPRRIDFSKDDLRDGGVDVWTWVSLQIGELRQIRNGRGAGGGACCSINQARLNDGIAHGGAIAARQDVIVAQNILHAAANNQRTERSAAAGDGVFRRVVYEVMRVAAGGAKFDGNRLGIGIIGNDGYGGSRASGRVRLGYSRNGQGRCYGVALAI